MRFGKLCLEWFASLGKIEIDLSQSGLFAVTGINEDKGKSNGSGKTSIFDGITWILFGETTKDTKVAEVVNRKSKGVCKGSLEIFDNGEKYTIERERNNKQSKSQVKVTTKDGAVVYDWAKDVRQCTKDIQQLIGMDLHTFLRSHYFPQRSLPSFGTMTDKQLKEYFLEELLDVGWVKDSLEAVRVDKNKKEKELVGLQQAFDYTIQEMESLCQEIAALTNKQGEWLADRALRILSCDDKVVELQKDIEKEYAGWQSEKDTAIECLNNEIAELSLRVEEEQKKWQTNQDAILGRMDEEIAELNETLEEYKTKEFGLASRLYDLKAKVEKDRPDDTTRKIIDELQAKKGELTHRIKAIRESGSKLINTLEKYEAARESVKARIGTKCETCGTEITKEHLPHLSQELEANIQNTQKEERETSIEHDILIQEYKKIAEKIKTAQVDIDTYNEKLREWGGIHAEYVQAEDRVKELDRERKVVVKRIEQKEQEKAKRQSEVYDAEFVNVQKKRLESQLIREKEDRNSIPSTVKTLENQIKHWEQKQEETKKEKNPYEQMVETKKQKEEETKQKARELKESQEQLEEELEGLKFWERGFSQQGIQSFLLDSITPILNERLRDVLLKLTDGEMTAEFSTVMKDKKGNWKEKFALNVDNIAGGGSYNLLSGGEMKRIDVCVNLVLGDFVRSRTSKNLEFICLDEVFRELDTDGIEQVLNYIADEYKGIPVYIITHDVVNPVHFNGEIVVEKKDGISRIAA